MPRKTYNKKRTFRKKAKPIKNTRKFRDKKINTLIEKKIQTIAKAEALKVRQMLIHRSYCFTRFNLATGLYSANYFYVKDLNQFIGNGATIDWTGRAIKISQIPRVDNASILNVAVDDVEETEQDEANYGSGVNVVGEIKVRHGKRINQEIKIHGFSINIRAFLRTIPQQSTAVEEDFLDTTNPQFNSSTIHWAIVTKAVDNTSPNEDLVIKQALRINFWGYSSALDLAENRQKKQQNIRKIMSGKIRMKHSMTMPTIRNVSKYIKLKHPIKIIYEVTDQKGINVENKEVYLVIRSDIPASALYLQYKPQVQCVTKVYYTD